MEKTKRSKNELIEKADIAISELVYDKVHLMKAYNYYAGIRDRMQFRHLEENYGIGSPASVTFTPLIRKHIDALVGEFLTLPIQPKISCKDSKTMSNIFREKQLAISKGIMDVIKPKLQNLIYSVIKGNGQNKIDDAQFAKELKDVEDWVDNNFISNYEMAAQNVVDYCLQARHLDFKNKLKQLLLDLFIAGETYYIVEPTSANTNINLKILNPLNTFPDKNVNSPYIKDSYRIVYREYLSKAEILVKYGSELSSEDIESLEGGKLDYSRDNVMLMNAMNTRIGCFDTDGLEAGIDVAPIPYSQTSRRVDLYVVYETYWIDYKFENKQRIETVHHVTRIGSDLHIVWDEVNIQRSIDNPNECSLPINGLHYMSRTGSPYSLVLATADLQDKYDIMQFYKNSIIANSGTAGDWVDLAFIPTFLGQETESRLAKWLAYKKSGIALLDSSQEGQQMNTTFSGYDDTVKLQAIQAVDLVIQDIENTATSITGVFRERLGGIQARDAVSNVEMGMQQSYIITKQYYQAMDLLVREMLLDCLNTAKIVFKNGLSGTLILGQNQKQIFTALPEYFTMSDQDIHIADSQEIIKERETIKQLTMELTKGGMVDPDILIAVSTSTSLTEMKLAVAKSIKNKKEENNQLQQLSQQSQQAQQQLKELQAAFEKAQAKIESLNEAKLQIDREKIQKNYETDMFKIKTAKEFNEQKIAQEKRRVDVEALQLIDNNPNNDEVRND